MQLCSEHLHQGLVKQRVEVCDSFWCQTYLPLLCAKLCKSKGTFEDEVCTLSVSLVLSGEADGYDI